MKNVKYFSALTTLLWKDRLLAIYFSSPFITLINLISSNALVNKLNNLFVNFTVSSLFLLKNFLLK